MVGSGVEVVVDLFGNGSFVADRDERVGQLVRSASDQVVVGESLPQPVVAIVGQARVDVQMFVRPAQRLSALLVGAGQHRRGGEAFPAVRLHEPQRPVPEVVQFAPEFERLGRRQCVEHSGPDANSPAAKLVHGCHHMEYIDRT